MRDEDMRTVLLLKTSETNRNGKRDIHVISRVKARSEKNEEEE